MYNRVDGSALPSAKVKNIAILFCFDIKAACSWCRQVVRSQIHSKFDLRLRIQTLNLTVTNVKNTWEMI